MKEHKINISYLLCEIVIFLQLLWMQTKVFMPNVNGFTYRILYYMKYLGTLLLIVYTFTIKRDKELKSKSKKYMLIFLPFLLLFVIVEVIAFLYSPIVEIYGINYVTRAVAYLLDKICIIVAVLSIYIICQKNTIDCVSNSLIANGIIIAIVVVTKYGLLETAKAFLGVFGIVEENLALKMLEVHELTYCTALCLIYYLFFYPTREKKDNIRIILLLLIFILGGKRIAFAGILFSGIASWGIHRKELMKNVIAIIGIIGVIISITYVSLLYNGKFMAYLEEHNINVMGRDYIYNYFLKRTDFSITNFGWGFAGVSKAIENMSKAEVHNMVSVRGLHNDLLKIYIECGFMGAICWYLFNLVYIPIKIFNKIGKKQATLYICLAIFTFITYLTDNTENYFVFQTVLFILPLASHKFYNNDEL